MDRIFYLVAEVEVLEGRERTRLHVCLVAGAAAGPLVQVGAALGAQPLAVVVAQGHERHLEQQGRHDERHQIDLAVVGQEVELVAFHILRRLRFLLAADEEVSLDITLQAVGHVLQAAGALGRGRRPRPFPG